MSLTRNLSGCQVFHPSQLPSDWDCVALKDRLELLYGRALKEEVRKSGDVDVFGSNGKVGSHNEHWLDAPGVLVGRKGTVGAVHYTEKPFWPIDTTYYVKPTGDDELRYLFYLLDYLPLKILNAATGVPGLSRRDAYALLGAFPPPDEQAAIVRVLDAVDAVIDRTREAALRAAELRKTLLADLLSLGVDTNGQVRKPSGSALIRTEIGLLPNTWRVSDVSREFEIQSGITLNEAQRSGQRRWRYLRVANVQRDALALEDVQTLLARESEIAARRLQQGDLLVVEGHADRRQIGRCALASADVVGMTFQNHLFRLRTQGAVLPEFGCLWLNSWHAQRYWNAMCATSSGLNTINQRMLKRLRIAVPSPVEQEKIVALTTASKAQVAELVQKSKALEQLKKSLMHDLLTGSVRVDPALFKQEASA